MPKKLTLRRHIAKMVDVCGPSYGPLVGLICFTSADPLMAKHANNSDVWMARLPDQRLALTDQPFHFARELRDDWSTV
jgi:hypothetical protein